MYDHSDLLVSDLWNVVTRNHRYR